MTRITLAITKPLEHNAALYFEKAKKAKRKLEGARAALAATRAKLASLEEKSVAEEKQHAKKQIVKREWYEKFHWFQSSEGFLCIGGRDATTNDIIVKKHASKGDMVFHTDMAGSPFFIIKAEGRPIGEATLQEAAQATASYSRAWRLGMASLEVFYVNPEQLTKEANAGEYLTKGSFIVRGKTTHITAQLEVAIGIREGKIIGGPTAAIAAYAKGHIILRQGQDKASEIAKKVKKQLGEGEIDEIIAFIPAGGSRIAKASR